ncbi:mCG1051033 [Mus musculus]|nr:mCG1051033 [Mus musculus]
MGARKHLRNPCPLLSLTTLPGFLDGLGQLLVLLHTDPYGEKRQPGQRPTQQQVFYTETADHLMPQGPDLYLPGCPATTEMSWNDRAYRWARR